MLTYSAIGCSSSTVGNVIEGGYMPHFASVIPQTSNVIDYRPKFTADIYYDDFYYGQSGTDIPAMSAGSYDIAILVNDVPSDTEYDYLVSNPFYSNYAVWDANVQIVSGTPFNASMSPAKNCYSAGEQVTVSWGVNSDYFTADSRLRITMSTDYGKTFGYVLADNVPALDGSKCNLAAFDNAFCICCLAVDCNSTAIACCNADCICHWFITAAGNVEAATILGR